MLGRRCSDVVIESTGRLYSFVASRCVVVLVDLSNSRHALVFLYFHQGQETMKSSSDYEHIGRHGYLRYHALREAHLPAVIQQQTDHL